MLALLDIQGLIDLEKRMYDKYKNSAYNLLKQETNLISLSKEDGRYISTEYEGNIAILFISEGKNPICNEKLYEDINGLRKDFFNKTGYEYVVGLSQLYENITDTGEAYRQALTALKDRFYQGGNSVIKYTTRDYSYGDLSEKSLGDNIRRLVNFIELCNAVNVRKELDEIFARIWTVRPKPDRVRDILKFIVTNLSAVQQEFREAVENRGRDEFDLVYHIENEDTYNELKAYFMEVIFNIVRHISIERIHRSKKIVEIAKDYINRNYSKDISLKSVAEHVHLSPNYFSDLFKNDTGKNFIDFLIEVRIDSAKKLLAKPDARVYEVGQQVGYEDPASFNRAFKKIVSVSPAEYKKLIN